MSSLLSPSYLSELSALRRSLRARVQSGGGGDHLARRSGGSAEFLEHKEYSPGDEPRRIDWLAFARTGVPLKKTFRAEEDVVYRLVIDASASLAFGTPPKIEHAKRIAASVGFLALSSSERAQVVVARDGVDAVTEPTRGKNGIARLLRDLDSVESKGGTGLGQALAEIVGREKRKGVLVVVSDFLDPAPFDVALTRAAESRHELVLVHVLAKEDIDPPFEGDVALEDSETGEVIEMTLDDRALAIYRQRLQALVENLRAASKRLRATYVKTETTEPPIHVMRRLLKKGID